MWPVTSAYDRITGVTFADDLTNRPGKVAQLSARRSRRRATSAGAGDLESATMQAAELENVVAPATAQAAAEAIGILDTIGDLN